MNYTMPKTIPILESKRITAFLQRTSEPEVQATLNGLAIKYCIADRTADANTVNERLRRLAQNSIREAP